MKKDGGVKYFLFVSILVLALIIILFSFNYYKFTGKAIYTPPVTLKECTNESITAIWDSLFKENSIALIINKSCSTDNSSYSFKAYKIKPDGGLYILVGEKNLATYLNVTTIVGRYINYTQNYLTSEIVESMTGLTSNRNYYNTNEFFNIATRSLTSAEQAMGEYTTYFKIVSPSLELKAELDNTYYWANDSEGAYIFQNYSINEFFYTLREETSCTPNWTRQETGCLANETKVIWYNDSNNCRVNTSKPESITNFCDYNSNGIIGDAASLSSNYNLSIFISGDSLNNSLNYSLSNTDQVVEIKNNGSTIVSFKHNFASSTIDFNNLSIKVNSDSSVYGYIVVNGISDTKSVILDKKNLSSNQVCIKDAYVSTITTISSSCEGGDEYLLNCPSSLGGFNCVIINSKFNISGLEHSAVKEVLSLGICNPNWICTNFSMCANLLQNRTCSDQNNCNTTSNRPTLNRSCNQDQIINSCAPNWVCDEWQPENCSSGKNQTRVCTDKNSCNLNIGKPEQIRVCEKTNSSSLLLIGLVVVIFIIITVLIILLFLKKKPSGAQPPVQNQQPFQPPVQPFQRIQPRPFPFPQQQLPPQPVIIPQYSIPPRDNRQ